MAEQLTGKFDNVRRTADDLKKVKSARDLLFKALGFQKRAYFVDTGAFNHMLEEGPSNVGPVEDFKAFPDQPLESIPADKAGTGFTVYVKYKK